jgi:hypothetical protein
MSHFWGSQFRPGNKRESIETNGLEHSDNATPPSVETVAGGAESLSREGLTKSRLFVGRLAALKVHSKKRPASVKPGEHEKAAAGLRQRRLSTHYSRGTLLRAIRD